MSYLRGPEDLRRGNIRQTALSKIFLLTLINLRYGLFGFEELGPHEEKSASHFPTALVNIENVRGIIELIEYKSQCTMKFHMCITLTRSISWFSPIYGVSGVGKMGKVGKNVISRKSRQLSVFAIEFSILVLLNNGTL